MRINTRRATSYLATCVLLSAFLLVSATPATETAVVADAGNVWSERALVEREGKLWQPVELQLKHSGPEKDATVRIGDVAKVFHLRSGENVLEVLTPPAQQTEERLVSVEGVDVVLPSKVQLEPVRKLTIYILPHSHHDIGYTETQVAVEKKQIENLRKAIAWCRRTADYPPGAQFKWNAEVLWSVDCCLRKMPEAQRAELFDAIKKGWIGLNGMYLNELTGLCRPEELLRLFRYSSQLAEKCGAKVESAMISDVPGYTWGTVTAMSKAGIRYFSPAPNWCARIGDIMEQWENKPFWVGVAFGPRKNPVTVHTLGTECIRGFDFYAGVAKACSLWVE